MVYQISDTKQSQFPLLGNPAMLPPLFASLTNPAANQLSLASLANSTTSHLTNLSSASTILQSYAPGVRKPGPAPPSNTLSEEEPIGPDPRDVDRVLGELVALGGRWALFRRFVSGRMMVRDDRCIVVPYADAVKDIEAEEGTTELPVTATEQDDMGVLEQSGSQRAIENLLKVYYEPLEVWFLRMSVEKV